MVTTGDMSTPGPYCNPFLVNMIYAQALPVAYPSGIPLTSLDMNGAPLQTTTQKDFIDRAKLVLTAELDKPSSVPTIQGLFILAGSECSRGNSSAGWLYAGMVSGKTAAALVEFLGRPADSFNLLAGVSNDARYGDTHGRRKRSEFPGSVVRGEGSQTDTLGEFVSCRHLANVTDRNAESSGLPTLGIQ